MHFNDINRVQATKTKIYICTVYENGAIFASTVRKWVSFRRGSFDLKVRECFGRPAVVVDNQIEALIKNDDTES